MFKTVKGIDNTKKSRCSRCSKPADCWIADKQSNGGTVYLCIDCYIKRCRENLKNKNI